MRGILFDIFPVKDAWARRTNDVQTMLKSLKQDVTQNTFAYNYTYLSNYQLHYAVMLHCHIDIFQFLFSGKFWKWSLSMSKITDFPVQHVERHGKLFCIMLFLQHVLFSEYYFFSLVFDVKFINRLQRPLCRELVLWSRETGLSSRLIYCAGES